MNSQLTKQQIKLNERLDPYFFGFGENNLQLEVLCIVLLNNVIITSEFEEKEKVSITSLTPGYFAGREDYKSLIIRVIAYLRGVSPRFSLLAS